MTPPVKLLVIYVDEVDTFESMPLYEAVIRQLQHLGIAGATAQAGVMGFGSHHKLHRKGLFGINADRPVTISVLDSEVKIREILPEIRTMVKDALVLLIDAELTA